MKVLVGILLFLFLAPVCILMGLFGSCMVVMAAESMGGASTINETFAMGSLFIGPALGFAGSIALTLLILRGIFPPQRLA